MTTQVGTAQRQVVLVEDAHIRPMMGLDILEPLPSTQIPYELVDPFILVHEGVVPITPEWASRDTRHPHRGFDNLWYLVAGSASTGHSTGPGGAIERARLETGSLPEAPDRPRRLARRREGDAIVRTLVGQGSPVVLGTPGLVLDVELPEGGTFGTDVPSDLNGFVYLLEGEADFGADRIHASRSQTALLGSGDALTVTGAQPGTRFMLMAGKPYGEAPIFNGPYVD